MKRDTATQRRMLIRELILKAQQTARVYRTVETWAGIVSRGWTAGEQSPHSSTVKRVLNQMVKDGKLEYKQAGRGWFHQDKFK